MRRKGYRVTMRLWAFTFAMVTASVVLAVVNTLALLWSA